MNPLSLAIFGIKRADERTQAAHVARITSSRPTCMPTCTTSPAHHGFMPPRAPVAEYLQCTRQSPTVDLED